MMHQHQGAPAPARPLAAGDWRLRATCRFTDPELFFPISNSGKGLEQAAEAKAVCAVRRECLAFAVRTRERHGIWGGTTEQERHPAWPAAAETISRMGAANEMEDHLKVLRDVARLASRPGDDLRGTQ
jgi:WhiB family redox-sensing transcriptional regulator